ncbi:MAG: glutathione peroxidase [Saprospiraceae bacterium]
MTIKNNYISTSLKYLKSMMQLHSFRVKLIKGFSLLLIFSLMSFSSPTNNSNVHSFALKSIDGSNINLGDYKGKILVLVNVASNGPLAVQYASLQKLHTEYKDKVVVVGFPSNSYRNELDTDKEIRSSCRSKYKVSFPLSTKIDVKGSNQHPLFKYLSSKSLNGVMDAPPNMDFQKYIIDQNGNLITTVEPNKDIYDSEAIVTIKGLIGV